MFKFKKPSTRAAASITLGGTKMAFAFGGTKNRVTIFERRKSANRCEPGVEGISSAVAPLLTAITPAI
jgi:hypothetical protein